MSLKNSHYCDILLNMSQINAHFNLISPTQKMPSAFFATDLSNRHTQTKRAPSRGVGQKMRHGERTNKSPIYEKCFSPKATGNYNNSLTNHVNKPIAYIPSFFSINFQSDSFYSHYFRIQRRKNPSVVYTFVECDVPKGTTHSRVQFNNVILHRAG